jgi:DNA-binding NarL/FixJ family response regulator
LAQQRLQLATTCRVDTVLLDYEMPAMKGREVASEINLVKPELAVILLSGREVPSQVLALVDAFVHKLEASRQLSPIIAELCSRSQKAKHTQESIYRREQRYIAPGPPS